VFGAATAIISPYAVGPLSMVVTTIWIDQDKKVTVDRSCAKNGTARSPGSSVSLPSSLTGDLQPNTGLVMAEASYAFQPRIGYLLTHTVTLDETYYLRPRMSERIDMTC
jgi:hypothetical protein